MLTADELQELKNVEQVLLKLPAGFYTVHYATHSDDTPRRIEQMVMHTNRVRKRVVNNVVEVLAAHGISHKAPINAAQYYVQVFIPLEHVALEIVNAKSGGRLIRFSTISRMNEIIIDSNRKTQQCLERDRLIASAREKLTPEERKAVGI